MSPNVSDSRRTEWARTKSRLTPKSQRLVLGLGAGEYQRGNNMSLKQTPRANHETDATSTIPCHRGTSEPGPRKDTAPEPDAPVVGCMQLSPCDLIESRRSHILLTLYRERDLSDAAFRVAVVLAVRLDEEVLLTKGVCLVWFPNEQTLADLVGWKDLHKLSCALSELMDKRIISRWVPSGKLDERVYRFVDPYTF